MVTLETVLNMAEQLSPRDKVRLIERLAPQIEHALVTDTASEQGQSRDLWGALAHLGPAPSAEEIDEARAEAWANFVC